MSLSFRFALGFVITRRGWDGTPFTDRDLRFVRHSKIPSPEFVECDNEDFPLEMALHAGVFSQRSTAIFGAVVSCEKGASTEVLFPKGMWRDQLRDALHSGNRFTIKGLGTMGFGCTVDDVVQAITTQR